MRMLLHVCCGPCAAYPVKFLKEQGWDLTGYFYNPNIHPYKEFKKRLETCREFAAKAGLPLVVDADYSLEAFLRQSLDAPEGRCRECYALRLRAAARYAREKGYECFSTTLLVSPYQQHDVIRELGMRIGEEEGIPFHYADFRPGWQEGVTISKELELYRQPYCGCIFSERDRYWKPGKETQDAGRI